MMMIVSLWESDSHNAPNKHFYDDLEQQGFHIGTGNMVPPSTQCLK